MLTPLGVLSEDAEVHKTTRQETQGSAPVTQAMLLLLLLLLL